MLLPTASPLPTYTYTHARCPSCSGPNAYSLPSRSQYQKPQEKELEEFIRQDTLAEYALSGKIRSISEGRAELPGAWDGRRPEDIAREELLNQGVPADEIDDDAILRKAVEIRVAMGLDSSKGEQQARHGHRFGRGLLLPRPRSWCLGRFLRPRGRGLAHRLQELQETEVAGVPEGEGQQRYLDDFLQWTGANLPGLETAGAGPAGTKGRSRDDFLEDLLGGGAQE